MSFSVDCVYCSPPNNTLMAFQRHGEQKQSEFDAAWKSAAALFGNVECPSCGSQYRLADDPFGSVKPVNTSRPKILSLNVTTGMRTGGNVLYISGVALEVGTLTVRFGGIAAPVVDERTATSARVVVPRGCYHLNVAELLSRLVVSVSGGVFQADETVIAQDGSTGVLRHISGTVYMVYMATIVTSLNGLIGRTLSGATSGATGTITAASTPVFAAGEVGRGITSYANGLMRSSAEDPYNPIVDQPTDAFVPAELVEGLTTGAMVKLTGSPAYSGLVDVVVENEYGCRAAGEVLVGAYTYQ